MVTMANYIIKKHMKAILEFNLNEPDERDAHKRAVKADDLLSAIRAYDNWLRSEIKYSAHHELIISAFEDARKQLHFSLSEYEWNIN